MKKQQRCMSGKKHRPTKIIISDSLYSRFLLPSQVSQNNAMDAGIQHTKVIKGSVQHLGWSDEYKEALEELVRTTHTYLFSRKSLLPFNVQTLTQNGLFWSTACSSIDREDAPRRLRKRHVAGERAGLSEYTYHPSRPVQARTDEGIVYRKHLVAVVSTWFFSKK